MNFNVSVLDIIIFLAAIQGISAIVIVRLHKNNAVSRSFCFLLFSFILITLKIQLHTLKLWEMPGFTYFPLAIDLLFQPALYIYFIAVTKADFKFNNKYYIHFLPCLLFMIHAIIVYFSVIGVNDIASKALIAEKLHYNLIKYIEDYLSVISSFTYCFLCYKLLQNRLKAQDAQSQLKSEAKNSWLKSLIILFLILSIFLAVNIILENIVMLGNRTFIYWTVFYTYLSGFLYYLSITSIQHPEMTIAPITFNTKKIDENKVLLIVDQLKGIMEKEKLYRIPDLTIQELAKKMNVSASNLSFAINTHFKGSYRDFINDYKISEVKEMLLNSKHQNLSMLGIATEAGFSSEATFYRIFKSKVGMSPKEFKDTSVKGEITK